MAEALERCAWCLSIATVRAKAPWGVYEKYACDEHRANLERVVRVDQPESVVRLLDWSDAPKGFRAQSGSE